MQKEVSSLLSYRILRRIVNRQEGELQAFFFFFFASWVEKNKICTKQKQNAGKKSLWSFIALIPTNRRSLLS